MPAPDLCLLFVRPLNRIGVRYMVTGSVAAILYGEPRMTHDVDLVVFLRSDDIERLQEAFAFPAFYIPPADVIANEIAREQRGHFNLVHCDTGFKADFYTTGRDDLNAWGFRHIRHLEYCGERLTVAPPEYVILRKLEYYREGGSDKHLRDIRSMLAISGGELDRRELAEWVCRRGLEPQWKQLSS